MQTNEEKLSNQLVLKQNREMQNEELQEREIQNQELEEREMQNKLKITIDSITTYFNSDNVLPKILNELMIRINDVFHNPKIIIFGGFLRELIRINNLDELDKYLKTDGDIDLFVKIKEYYLSTFHLFIQNFCTHYSVNNDNIEISYQISNKYNIVLLSKLYTLIVINLQNNTTYKIDFNISKNYSLFNLKNKFDVSINSLCYEISKKKLFSKKKELISVSQIYKHIKNNQFTVIPNINENEKIDRILKLIYIRKYEPNMKDKYTVYYMTWLSLNLINDYDDLYKTLISKKCVKKANFINSLISKNKTVKSDLLHGCLCKSNILKCLQCNNSKQNFNDIYCYECYINNIDNNIVTYNNKYCIANNYSNLFNIAINEEHLELVKLLSIIFDLNNLQSAIINKLVDFYVNQPNYETLLNKIKSKLKNKNVIIDGIIRRDNVLIFKDYCKKHLKNNKVNKLKIIKYLFYFNSPNIIKAFSKVFFKKEKKRNNIFAPQYKFDDITFGKICSYNNIDLIKIYMRIFKNKYNSYIFNPKNRDEYVKQDNFIENISAKCTIEIIKLLTKQFNLKYNSTCIRKYMDYNITIEDREEKVKNIEFFVRNLRETNMACTIDGNMHFNDIYCTVLRCNPNCYSLLYDNTKGSNKKKYENMLKIAELYLYIRPNNWCTCINCINIKKVSYYILAMQFILYIKGCDFNFVNKIAIQYF